MPNTFTITLTDAEMKAMEWACADVQDWIDNVVKNRARQAIDDIYALEVERMTNDPTIDAIPANKEKVVLAAAVKTAKERSEEVITLAEEGLPVPPTA